MEDEKKHQEDLRRIREFRLIDDDFMNVCLDGDVEATQLILRIILGRPDITVRRVTTQKVMKNLLGRDVWLDVDADDADGKVYDVEIQRSDKGADRKRARYHSSIMDAHLLSHGDDFSDLPESYVIFITERDVLGGGLAIYGVERTISETGEAFGDGEHIVYVNGENRNDSTELGRLMQDFFCTDPKDMHYKELADKVRYFKEDEKGVNGMCKALEDMRREVAEETWVEAKKDTIRNLVCMGKLTMEEIAKVVNMPIEKVEEIADELLATAQ